MYSRASRRRGLVAAATLGLLAAPLTVLATTAPAQATTGATALVISEAYGGGGNSGATLTNDFIELFNPTSSAISVAGMSVQYRSGSGTGVASGVTDLTGSVPAGGHYLVQEAAGTAGTTALPTPDATGTIAMGGSSFTVFLATGTTAINPGTGAVSTSAAGPVVDLVSANSNTFEGAVGPATSNATSTSRSAAGGDTDNNATDLTVGTPDPQNSAGGPVTPGALAATNPGSKTATVNAAITPFTLPATGGTSPYTWTATGLPTGLSISSAGQVSGTPTATGTFSVTATVTDSAATPATATTTFTYTVSEPGAQLTIAQIQGTTDTTPYANQAVTTTGVVTAAFPTGGLNGFYLQTGGPDTTPDASDGVFVYAPSFNGYPTKGDTVTVSGTAKEFAIGGSTLTEIEVANAGDVTAAATAQPAVVAQTLVPGTDCVQGSCLTGAALASARESVEGEAFLPTGDYTATDVYDGSPYPSTSSGNFGEIGLAAESDVALIQPTELYDAQTQAAEIGARKAYNDAHRIIMDDGSSLNYSVAANTGLPIPWFTASHYVRNGAAVTFPQTVVLTVGFDGATFLPASQVVGAPTGKVTFAQDRPAAPSPVGGDIKLATFNVLNYFPTTGEAFAATSGNACTYYTDRAGNPITDRNCTPDGPRGAANDVNLQRQQDKIVNAINSMGASIVSLEEIENSVKFGKDRDFGVQTLVAALNADAGAGTWAFAPSPAAADLPAESEQDVIRTAFIYQAAQVSLVGASQVLVGSSAFSNARQPLAQGFKKAGDPDSNAFTAVVNHFKSKGSGTDDGTGQGNANPDRVNQAVALKSFASSFSSTLGGSGAVFLTGDFNAYTSEDPVQKLEENGDYAVLESTTTPGEESYNFAGLDGSLDHVFANPTAEALVTGVDIWNINGDESVYREYSRYNYNVTDLYNSSPYRASDHNPEIIGLDLSAASAPVDVQILATNDFHGRIQNDTFSASAGAAVLAGAVKQLRGVNPNTVFAAAGDLIGASTFESFIAKDKPTIDALNEAGLEVSAVGNHEFDQGYNDLVDRVMAPYDANTNPNGGANWKYLGANVKFKDSGDPALDGTWVKTMDGVQVGFIGAVTEHLPELVSPSGISNITVTNIATAANTAADDLKATGADVVVLLVHEGAAGTSCDTINTDTTSDFGKVTSGVNDNIDAIVSGHTHLTYNCSQPVPGWSTRAVTTRPIVSAGQYGYNLNKIVFTVDPTTGAVQSTTQAVLPLKTGTSGSTFNYPVDSATKTIVDDAVANAKVLGAQPLGNVGGAFYRAKLADGTTENRGGESTLGNLVAEIQKWATTDPTFGSAQIAFMNPGGLRADLTGQGTAAFPHVVTYKDAANVQPFANTLVNEDLTGAQIKAVLEQQWQPTGASRPFLKLGISKGFTYTYDPAAAQGSRIKAMYLNGDPLSLTDTYSVTVNSFLSTGGDNFTALIGTGRKQDTGRTDLQAQVDYFAEFASDSALPVDFSQRAVGATFPSDAPASYPNGGDVTVNLSSLSMTGPGDPVDTTVDVSLDGDALGSFPVTTTLQTATPGYDEVGTATAVVTLPADLAGGAHDLVVTGNSTGTEAMIPVVVDAPTPVPTRAEPTIVIKHFPATVRAGQTRAKVLVKVSADGVKAQGFVRIRVPGKGTKVVKLDADGRATLRLARFSRPGVRTVVVTYNGSATIKSGTARHQIRVVR